MEGMNSIAPASGFPRAAPQNAMAEQSVIGGIMSNSKNLHGVADFLRPDHFANAMHGRIFGEQRRLIMAGGIADAVTLRGWFEADPDAAAAGGFAYLSVLIKEYVGPGTTVPYARVIVDTWTRRELIATGEDMTDSAFDLEHDAAEAAVAAIARIDATIQPEGAARATSLDQAMDAAIAAADAASKRDGPAGISTGFPSIDTALGGLEPGTLTVLAGRPGMGKSALGWQVALHTARQGVGVLVVSLEMSAVELGRRALSAASGVPVVALKNGTLSASQADAIMRARHELADLPLVIEDSGGLTAAQIMMKARSARRRHSLGLVMVDHLHIMAAEAADARQGPTHAIGAASAAMKRMAKDMACPVLLLAQLSRAVESRDDKRPGLSDLRQSGGIEQDADAVMFVYRPEYYLKTEPERREGESLEKFRIRSQEFQDARDRQAGRAELIVAKVRDGDTGTVNLEFHGPTTSFRDVDGSHR